MILDWFNLLLRHSHCVTLKSGQIQLDCFVLWTKTQTPLTWRDSFKKNCRGGLVQHRHNGRFLVFPILSGNPPLETFSFCDLIKSVLLPNRLSAFCPLLFFVCFSLQKNCSKAQQDERCQHLDQGMLTSAQKMERQTYGWGDLIRHHFAPIKSHLLGWFVCACVRGCVDAGVGVTNLGYFRLCFGLRKNLRPLNCCAPWPKQIITILL